MVKSRKGWKLFEKWLHQEVEETFGIVQQNKSNDMDELLHNLPPLNDVEQTAAKDLSSDLTAFVNKWNEEDLKMYFISPLIILAQLKQKTYRAFFDCTLKTELRHESIGGRVDCVVGKGSQFPVSPLFFLQEYKPKKNPSGDPLGQLLIAMLAAQQINNDTETPLFGCYIVGQLWAFVVLKGNDYTVSNDYDATQEEKLSAIIGILKKIKIMYEIRIGLIDA
jgi:hypothetical protein